MFDPESFNKDFDAFRPIPFDAFARVKNVITENIPLKNCKLLDIGTGDGKSFSEIVLKQLKDVEFSTVIGSDFDKKMIEFASKNYVNCSYKLLDIEKENFGGNSEWKNYKNSFDIATSSFTFVMLKDMKVGFENVKELLKPKGVFWCFIPGYASFLDILMKCMEAPKYSKYKQAVFGYLPPYHRDANFKQNFSKMLNDCGFEVIFEEYTKVKPDLGSKYQFTYPVLAGHIRLIPENLRDDLINDVIKEQEKIRAADGRNLYEVDIEMISVVVKKK